ncbi:hypothetical protein AB4Z40_24680, partial [Bosea sp. 2YAB26]|uniref:hypothetical protein n=1 Tax=Bosea sp. 2YAB26 TaxID=3237478 RepID=UPI003F8DB128
ESDRHPWRWAAPSGDADLKGSPRLSSNFTRRRRGAHLRHPNSAFAHGLGGKLTSTARRFNLYAPERWWLMTIVVLRLFLMLFVAMAGSTAKSSGPIAFFGQVEGTSETLSGHLELREEGWPTDKFKFRSNGGIDCVGPMYQKAGVLHEAVLRCSDGRSGLIRLRIYGENSVTEATLGERKLILSIPNHPRHRSR